MAGDEPFLSAIREKPEDDAPRLVYADFLDETGRPERAAFIRLQVALARTRHNHGAGGEPCRACKLQKAAASIVKDRDWIDRDPYHSIRSINPSDFPGEKVCRWGWLPPPPTTLGGYLCGPIQVRFGRGFVDQVALAADDWLECGDAILDRHPIRIVRLTTPLDRDALRDEYLRRGWCEGAIRVPEQKLRDIWPQVKRWHLSPDPYPGFRVYDESPAELTPDQWAAISRRLANLGPSRTVVHHVNGDPTDNRPENLRAVDFRENRANR